MEFWIGLSVGMHLSGVIADYLQKFGEAYGLLEPTTVRKIDKIKDVEHRVSSLVERVVD
jgi:hypothetical protein